MSSCAASCCICFPRASFVSATSVSLPTADAPPYCRCASLPWVRFPCRSNRKPPLKNRTLFGAAPSVADQWRSSNDLPLLKSNSVLHLCWSQLRHETARPQLENSAWLTALRPRPPCSRPDPYFAPCIPPFSTIDSASHALDNLHLRFRADSRQLQHLFLAPFNLHKARVRRASGFLLTAFSNARPILCSAPHRSPRARLRKSTSVTRAKAQERPMTGWEFRFLPALRTERVQRVRCSASSSPRLRP